MINKVNSASIGPQSLVAQASSFNGTAGAARTLHSAPGRSPAPLQSSMPSKVTNKPGLAAHAMGRLSPRPGTDRATAGTGREPLGHYLGVKPNAEHRLLNGTGASVKPRSMLDGIEPVRPSINSLHKGAEPMKPGFAPNRLPMQSVLDNIAPVKPSITTLLNGIEPVQARAKAQPSAMQSMLNTIEPVQPSIASKSSTMQSMLNSIERVQPNIKTTLANIETVQPSIASTIDSIGGPVQPSFGTTLFNRIGGEVKPNFGPALFNSIGGYVEPAASGASPAKALRERLLPTDPVRLDAGRELMSKLRGESQMKWLMQNGPALALDAGRQSSASTPSLDARPVAAGDLAQRSKAVYGVTLPTPDVSLQPAGLPVPSTPTKSPSAAQFFTAPRSQTKNHEQSEAGQFPSFSESDTQDDVLRATRSRAGVWDDIEPSHQRAAGDHVIDEASRAITDIGNGMEVSFPERLKIEFSLIDQLDNNPGLTETQRGDLTQQWANFQEVRGNYTGMPEDR